MGEAIRLIVFSGRVESSRPVPCPLRKEDVLWILSSKSSSRSAVERSIVPTNMALVIHSDGPRLGWRAQCGRRFGRGTPRSTSRGFGRWTRFSRHPLRSNDFSPRFSSLQRPLLCSWARSACTASSHASTNIIRRLRRGCGRRTSRRRSPSSFAIRCASRNSVDASFRLISGYED